MEIADPQPSSASGPGGSIIAYIAVGVVSALSLIDVHLLILIQATESVRNVGYFSQG